MIFIQQLFIIGPRGAGVDACGQLRCHPGFYKEWMTPTSDDS